jgi:hypothetical protein
MLSQVCFSLEPRTWRGVNPQHAGIGTMPLQILSLFSQVCPQLCPSLALKGTRFSHPPLRSGQTFGLPPTHFIRYPYSGTQKHLRTVVLRQLSALKEGTIRCQWLVQGEIRRKRSGFNF